MELIKGDMNSIRRESSLHPIILFDGRCNLCSRFAQFVVGHDTQGIFRFGTLQSEAGHAVLNGIVSDSTMATIFFFHEDRVEMRSDAVLKILMHLGGAWRFFSLLMIVPKSVRDAMYRFISRHRYRIFGERQSRPAAAPDELEKCISSMKQGEELSWHS